MRKTILGIALMLSLSLNAFFTVTAFTFPEPPPREQEVDWDTFVTALAWVESRWDDNAESNRQAAGYLQITPILVEDANRICGKQVYSLQGRFDRKESIRLFNTIMDEYNPRHDMHLALKIWNPYSKVSYHRAVEKKYIELKKSGQKAGKFMKNF